MKSIFNFKVKLAPRIESMDQFQNQIHRMKMMSPPFSMTRKEYEKYVKKTNEMSEKELH